MNQVNDFNDVVPETTKNIYYAHVTENRAQGEKVFKVEAEDMDLGQDFL